MADVIVDRSGGAAVVRLNRPEQRNSVGGELFGALIEAVEAADADGDVRAIVTVGEGRTYCVGADLDTLTALAEDRIDLGVLGTDEVGGRTGLPVLSPEQRRVDHLGLGRWAARFLDVGTPTVAAVNGGAAGGGFALAMLHDVRIMSSTAKLSPGFAALGFAPEMGVSWLLPRIIGHAKAFRVLTRTTPIDAQEALDLGLVERVVEPDELLPAALEIARSFAASPDRSLRVIKRLLRQSWDTGLADHLEREWGAQRMLFADSQTQELVAAVVARTRRNGRPSVEEGTAR